MNGERPEDVQATFTATLVDEWVRGGLHIAVVCPGSRSTPLALALADHPGVTVQVQHDERSGGFLALGTALASGRPSLVLVTSGTAAAELHPAVVEAHHAGVSLLVCTADRPPELRDVGAPQTIDQAHIFGGAVRWFVDPGVADAATAPRWRSFAARALIEAVGPPPGPVHLNLPFREPLVGTPGPLPAARQGGTWTRTWRSSPAIEPTPEGTDRAGQPASGLPGGSVRGLTAPAATPAGDEPENRTDAPSPDRVAADGGGAEGPAGSDTGRARPLVGQGGTGTGTATGGAGGQGRGDGPGSGVSPADGTFVPGFPGLGVSPGALAGRRGVILAGHPSGPAEPLVQVAEALGWPVVADPRAPVWGATSPVVVAHLDGILRDDGARAALRPEVILRLGGVAASRVVNEWCAASGAEEIVVPGAAWSGAGWSDPAGTAAVVVPAEPAQVTASLAHQLDVGGEGVKPVPGWLDAWRAASDAAAAAVRATLASLPGPHEPGVAHDVVAGLPDGAQLVVSSSMPIRDVERYAAPRPGLRLLANRGANGIDGVVSTAVGAAVARPDGVTGLLIGDLAFLHDSNGLLGLATRPAQLVCVVVDNDGGGIFSFLPQARRLATDRFEQLFGTPHGLDLVAVARAYGVPARLVDGSEDVAAAVRGAADAGGVQVLVARTDRAANVEAHRRLDDAIAAAVARSLG